MKDNLTLPEHEQRKLLAKETKSRRMELREVKINIWKKWRKAGKNTQTITENAKGPMEDKWLGKLEETLARMRSEVEKRRSAKLIEEKRRTKLLQDNKIKQENILREGQEKADKKIKKKMLEERWAMTKWITAYIEENTSKWEKEKKEREENSKHWLEAWARNTRFEKIRIIREKEEKEKIEKVKLTVTIIPERLSLAVVLDQLPVQPEDQVHVAAHPQLQHQEGQYNHHHIDCTMQTILTVPCSPCEQ